MKAYILAHIGVDEESYNKARKVLWNVIVINIHISGTSFKRFPLLQEVSVKSHKIKLDVKSEQG